MPHLVGLDPDLPRRQPVLDVGPAKAHRAVAELDERDRPLRGPPMHARHRDLQPVGQVLRCEQLVEAGHGAGDLRPQRLERPVFSKIRFCRFAGSV